MTDMTERVERVGANTLPAVQQRDAAMALAPVATPVATPQVSRGR